MTLVLNMTPEVHNVILDGTWWHCDCGAHGYKDGHIESNVKLLYLHSKNVGQEGGSVKSKVAGVPAHLDGKVKI